jgi:hypothetical protein
MSKVGRRLAAGFAQLDAIYAELPTIACKGLCSIACGAIVLSDLEARRLQLTTHTAPRTTADGRCIYLRPTDGADGKTRGRCTAYAVRPLICRVWGLVQLLSCMHGCVPDRWLGDVAFVRLAQRLERIAGGRVLRTHEGGLAHLEGESFASVGRPTRSPEAIAANAERTRALRALHGGHILCAVDETDR